MPVRLSVVHEKARALLGLVEDLPLEGFERSFKISRESVLWNRFLLGIDKNNLELARLLAICGQLGMPEAHLIALRDSLPMANQVLFGFEESPSGCIYKVYLEFWEKIKEKLRTRTVKTEPELMHLGFKWDPEDPGKRAVSSYTCYPYLSNREILERLTAIYHGYPERESFEAVREILLLASRQVEDGSFIYLEVTEGSNPRKSFDVNLYKANLLLKDLRPVLAQVRQHYGILPESFDPQYERVAGTLFGHIAGGVDRRGTDFLTLYYEEPVASGEHPAAVAGAKVGRNDPCPCGSGLKYKKCCGA